MAQRLFDEIKRLIDDTLSGVHTAMPGTITSANGMTASVKPSVTFRTADGKSMAYPSISGCPIVLPMSANGKIGVAFPVSAGRQLHKRPAVWPVQCNLRSMPVEVCARCGVQG